MAKLLDYFYPNLLIDNLSGFIALGILFFGILTILYSLGFMRGKSGLFKYYVYVILTIISSIFLVLANDLILLTILWGFLGLTLYLLINIEGPQASNAAKKTFIIVGGSDSLMILGIAIVWMLARTFQMDKINLTLDNNFSIIAYILLATACFAKAGAMPLHTWVPDCAKDAPVPVTAFLPASLDKLLGIYLLARISLNLFVINDAINILLMSLGSITIVAAVMMALMQHDLKRLLGYHAVSQVGYMVLGIGTGSLIGIAGGIFHMLNNAIYKSSLFLTAGNVQKATGTTDLDRLGGLAKFMPITFIGAVIASLSISGVPPFNGFVSKWMIYQGLIQRISLNQTKFLSSIFLLAAMFGSALTLASFMKILHATFLGMSDKAKENIKESHWTMWLPVMILSALCILFGVFARQIPLSGIIFKAVGKPSMIGFWSSKAATLLIVFGLAIGFIIYIIGNIRGKVREDSAYTGGEESLEDERVTGIDFYNTIKELPLLGLIYKKAENKLFDIYEQAKKIVSLITRQLKALHNGVLPTYIVWCLLGMVVLFLTILKNG